MFAVLLRLTALAALSPLVHGQASIETSIANAPPTATAPALGPTTTVNQAGGAQTSVVTTVTTTDASNYVTTYSTTTVTASQTGPGSQATDEADRRTYLNWIQHDSLKALSKHKFKYPTNGSYYACSKENAIEVDTPIPLTSGENATNLILVLAVPDSKTQEPWTPAIQYGLGSRYSNLTSFNFTWIDSTIQCNTGPNNFLVLLSDTCIKDNTVPVESCVWATSEEFEFKASTSPLDKPLPSIKGASNGAMPFAASGAISVAAVAAAVLLAL